jgi:quinoprotein dehydrogenase-associated probable ABC transporter substrate-binding protein
MPFSNKAEQGFENKIATLVADRLDARVEYVWWAQRRGFIRNTLRAGTCDVVMGLPTEMEMAATTRPYYRSTYVFVTRDGSHQPASFDDPYLSTTLIGVHMIGDDGNNTPPAHALSRRGLINNVRGYSVYGDYKSPDPPADLIKAVSKGDVGVAVAWGPLAGYFAKQSAVPLRLTPVTPPEEPPYQFQFEISMGVARSNKALLAELNDVITQSQPSIDAILRDYGVPLIADAKVATR